MKFVLNTSIDPHFCALFADDGQLIEVKIWTDRKRDGVEVFNFLKKHDVHNAEITLCGGVSGPGGFSSLRAGAGVLNALSFAKKIPVHQVRADRWIAHFLVQKGCADLPFVLNSFSDGVFLVRGEELQRVTVDEAVEHFDGQEVFVELLPEAKQQHFNRAKNIKWEHQEQSLLEVLQLNPSQEAFHPEYAFPAV